jgi:hypothetical protein
MKPGTPSAYDESDALSIDADEVEQASEDDLWFLPGPMDDEPEALSQTSTVDPSGSWPDIAFIQEHQTEAER